MLPQVEDDETPEMIMAKFAELERIQTLAGEKAKQVGFFTLGRP